MSTFFLLELFLKYHGMPHLLMFMGTDALIILAFYFIIRSVYSPENERHYREESFIPLDDDSDEEKQLFGTHQTFSSRRNK
ncbi:MULTISPECIES: hypothetical protein [Methylophaga]|uniref:Uncharacterized protein n=2 Tax=Methylophaga TaxID=40222 RepID=A0ABP3D196_9GAMM|nr:MULTISPECIES: hypothetical protein [Methylophaga]BDZ72787.1 hypothetical protein GCM10025856_05060 [Methylophaga marina]|tara:strand:- start:1116 stop:1358 length:243 start_codon:yes stop_codon:yes gene_type:complete